MKNEYTNRLEIVKEALRHTEMKLSQQEEYSKLTDTRFFQLGAAIIVLASAILASETFVPFLLAKIVIASTLFVLALVTFWKIRPQQFYPIGGSYKNWEGHLTDGEDLIDVLISQAKENDGRFEKNEKILEKRNKIFTFLMICLALILAYLVYFQLECWQNTCVSNSSIFDAPIFQRSY